MASSSLEERSQLIETALAALRKRKEMEKDVDLILPSRENYFAYCRQMEHGCRAGGAQLNNTRKNSQSKGEQEDIGDPLDVGPGWKRLEKTKDPPPNFYIHWPKDETQQIGNDINSQEKEKALMKSSAEKFERLAKKTMTEEEQQQKEHSQINQLKSRKVGTSSLSPPARPRSPSTNSKAHRRVPSASSKAPAQTIQPKEKATEKEKDKTTAGARPQTKDKPTDTQSPSQSTAAVANKHSQNASSASTKSKPKKDASQSKTKKTIPSSRGKRKRVERARSSPPQPSKKQQKRSSRYSRSKPEEPLGESKFRLFVPGKPIGSPEPSEKESDHPTEDQKDPAENDEKHDKQQQSKEEELVAEEESFLKRWHRQQREKKLQKLQQEKLQQQIITKHAPEQQQNIGNNNIIDLSKPLPPIPRLVIDDTTEEEIQIPLRGNSDPGSLSCSSVSKQYRRGKWKGAALQPSWNVANAANEANTNARSFGIDEEARPAAPKQFLHDASHSVANRTSVSSVGVVDGENNNSNAGNSQHNNSDTASKGGVDHGDDDLQDVYNDIYSVVGVLVGDQKDNNQDVRSSTDFDQNFHENSKIDTDASPVNKKESEMKIDIQLPKIFFEKTQVFSNPTHHIAHT